MRRNQYFESRPNHRYTSHVIVVILELCIRIAQIIFGHKRVNAWMATQIKKYVMKPATVKK